MTFHCRNDAMFSRGPLLPVVRRLPVPCTYYVVNTSTYVTLPRPRNPSQSRLNSHSKMKAPPLPPTLYTAATCMSLLGWSLAWVVDKSCAFVVIVGRDSSAGEAVNSITRGTQEGQYRPGDTCRPWRLYQNEGALELDSNMIATRVAASLSIVFGAFILGGLFVAYLKEWRRVRRSELSKVEGREIVSNRDEESGAHAKEALTTQENFQKPNYWLRTMAGILSLAVAAFQGLTHLMVSSELCAGTNFQTVNESTGAKIIWDECVVDTAAYRITFPSIVIWAITALILLRLPLLDLSQ